MDNADKKSGKNADEGSENRNKDDDSSPIMDSKLIQDARSIGRKGRHDALDFAIVQLFCVGGLSTSLASRPEWKALFEIVDPSYRPASRSRLEDNQIIAEAEEVGLKQLKKLSKEENLTISCDGGTSKGREAFWTVHISTAQGKTYFIEGRHATDESHTAVWIKAFVLEIIDSIGRWRFCCVVCDSTGNTLLFRRFLVETIPTMFNLPDICHHISNTIKDIVRLPFFAEVRTFHSKLTEF